MEFNLPFESFESVRLLTLDSFVRISTKIFHIRNAEWNTDRDCIKNLHSLQTKQMNHFCFILYEPVKKTNGCDFCINVKNSIFSKIMFVYRLGTSQQSTAIGQHSIKCLFNVFI